MLNRIILQGRLTRDPELRTTQAGISVCSFTLAVDRDFKRDGEKETDFIDIVAWRATADFVSKYFNQGFNQGPHGVGGGTAPDPRMGG